ncbi:tRNA (adenine22-N1)-methyltransferase [Alkalihalobacillus xiaoxiensis]|uniref:tRNA (Adenine22-N1)-methyltransferase n=1 Tax=Shouchella xiaoxiensis TaxID=766895 RepID=A0ABS2SRH5_9BACI|nr:tRNA (adenine(22)-N(1))-methyltransferase TrmK [Shouchella xiaoxiensis]MBM7838112.1 tRNA (adenine22-N1)-methyltransferase [Shouchella xiaoxiensis]
MNANQLSTRLERVADYLKGFQTIADIGSDHAYLPCYLALNNKMVKAIAGEVNDGPYQSAQAQVVKSGLSEQVQVRKGNGLAVIGDQDQIEAVAVAGMGGPLIASILEDGKEKLNGIKRLVLQPNIAAHTIRIWLVKNGFTLVDEIMIKEDDKIYEILVAEPVVHPPTYTAADVLLGPILRDKQGSAFKEKWEREVHSWEQVLNQLQKGKASKEKEIKHQELMQKISLVKGVLS